METNTKHNAMNTYPKNLNCGKDVNYKVNSKTESGVITGRVLFNERLNLAFYQVDNGYKIRNINCELVSFI